MICRCISCFQVSKGIRLRVRPCDEPQPRRRRRRRRKGEWQRRGCTGGSTGGWWSTQRSSPSNGGPTRRSAPRSPSPPSTPSPTSPLPCPPRPPLLRPQPCPPRPLRFHGSRLRSLSRRPPSLPPLRYRPRRAPSLRTYVFYLSKLYELANSFLILLVGRRGLTFLHAVVVVMCYVWLSTSQSLMPIALVTNAGVHVAMHAYHLSSSGDCRWPLHWKRAVTELQIARSSSASSSLASSSGITSPTVGSRGCSAGSYAAFNASLLALFINFRLKAYKEAKNNPKKVIAASTASEAKSSTAVILLSSSHFTTWR
ncbi:hypothetical protein B296_00049012 [Ensete ventricosum]|uniref:very-long-chain 3-oxoacyl-CoA synthase n=1 Tax=Ensete ventricosum TaxID=4639 RepID=A0A426YSI2_ENSVE|nr:hypothetical protein B296_00049012 [Ensete ventricosum]